MNKKLINSFLLGATLVLSAGAFVSCQDYESDINDLTDRVSAVEKVSKELQALIQKGSVITNVESSAKGVKVTLSSGETFEITNGTNGADGKDGKDGAAGKDGKPGSVVTIGSDGYWYIDGVKTEYKAQGEKGEKGDQGETGPQGPQGPKGEDGKDATGIYYYPGTEGAEKGFWVKVTVVGGNETKEVTTLRWAPKEEDRIGVVWTDGQLKLTNVKGYDGTLTIDLNTYLKALVFKPEMVLDGQNAMEYIYIPYNPVVTGEVGVSFKHAHMRHTAHGWTEVLNNYGVGETAEHGDDLVYLNPTYDKLYSLDPSKAIVPAYTQAHLGTVSQDPDFVKTTRAASVPNYAANPAAAEPTATFLDIEDGIMHVGITMKGQLVKTQEESSPRGMFDFYPHETDASKITDLAVTAPLGEGKETITSTWASVYASQMVFENLSYTDFAKQYTYVDPEHERSSWSYDEATGKFVQHLNEPGKLLGYGADKHAYPVEGGMHLYHNVYGAAEMVATLELAYDNKEGINLNKLVAADVLYNSRRSWNDGEIKTLSEAELKDLGMKFNFVKVPYIVGEAGLTEQTQNHCVLQPRTDGTYIVACGVKSNSDTDPFKCEPDLNKLGSSRASVGRTPLIKVELRDTVNNNKVAELGYIKFIIVETEKPIITKVFDLGNFYYQCDFDYKQIAWHAIEQKVLDEARDMSKETFNLLYEAVKYPHVVDNWFSDFDNPNDPRHPLAQWVPTGEKDIYGQPTFKLADNVIGHFVEIKEPDSETTNTIAFGIWRDDFVNCVNDATYPSVEEVRYIKFVPRKGLGDSNFNCEPVYVPIKMTLTYPKGVMANKIPKYWYAANSFNPANDVLDKDKLQYIHGNVEAPGNEADLKVGNADFEVYLDERFAKTTTGHTHGVQWTAGDWAPADFCFYKANTCNDKPENAPSFSIVPEAFSPAQAWNTAENFPSFVQEELVYLYYFTLGNVKTVKGVSGKEYKLTVDNPVANSPVMLYSDPDEFEYKNTVLYANDDSIAVIQYHYNPTTFGPSASREHEAKLVVLNNDTTKDLINIPEGKASLATADSEAVVKFFEDTFDVELGVAVFNKKCGAYLPLADNTFKAELLKPVYVEPAKTISFTDAPDNGTQVALYDLVKFYDWRAAAGDKNAYVFASHGPVDLYKYYEVDLITVNPEDIMTDLSGEFKPLKEYSNGVEFQVYDGKTKKRIDNGTVVDPKHKCTAKKGADNYDYLKYYNNTTTVTNFNIKVPVKIHHKWSQKDLIVWVDGTVNRTVGN